MQALKESDSSCSLQILLDSIHSEYTKRSYIDGLKMFMQFHNIKNYDTLLQFDVQKTVEMIRRFIMYQRNTRQLSLSRINVCFSALKLFYEMNDYNAFLTTDIKVIIIVIFISKTNHIMIKS